MRNVLLVLEWIFDLNLIVRETQFGFSLGRSKAPPPTGGRRTAAPAHRREMALGVASFLPCSSVWAVLINEVFFQKKGSTTTQKKTHHHPEKRVVRESGTSHEGGGWNTTPPIRAMGLEAAQLTQADKGGHSTRSEGERRENFCVFASSNVLLHRFLAPRGKAV